MASMMPQTDGGEPQRLHEKHSSDIQCKNIEGHAEYSIYIPDATLDDLHEEVDHLEFAEHMVESHLESELESEDSLIKVECRAQKIDDWDSMSDDDETEFNVWARFY